MLQAHPPSASHPWTPTSLSRSKMLTFTKCLKVARLKLKWHSKIVQSYVDFALGRCSAFPIYRALNAGESLTERILLLRTRSLSKEHLILS